MTYDEGGTFMDVDDTPSTGDILNGIPIERKKEDEDINTQSGNNSTILFADPRLILISIIITLFLI